MLIYDNFVLEGLQYFRAYFSDSGTWSKSFIKGAENGVKMAILRFHLNLVGRCPKHGQLKEFWPRGSGSGIF